MGDFLGRAETIYRLIGNQYFNNVPAVLISAHC